MVCIQYIPQYLPSVQRGLKTVNSLGDGYTMSIFWQQAFPDNNNLQIAYNIYFSTRRESIFTEGPKFLSLNTTGRFASVQDFTPGDMFYFAVRAMEYDLTWFNPALLPDGDGYNSGLKIYPESMLLNDITDSDMLVPIEDINIFPAYGVVVIGSELIRYISKDIPANNLIVGERGFLGTVPRLHTVDGYDGVKYYDNPLAHFFIGFEDGNNFVNQEQSVFNDPNFARTNTDGYKERLEDLLTTDLGASDADRVDFPAYDYVGWHRTNPADLFNGMCLDTYMGGEHFCADGYHGVGNQIRNMSLAQQSDRRQEMLLDLTGEPVVLVRRLWKGVVCSCYEINKEHPEPRCHVCFVPGTLVKTELGYRPIEQIKIGEKVLSSDGLYHNVTNVFENLYAGSLQSITSSINTNPILTTPEHPFLVLRGDHNKKNGCGPKCNIFINHGDGNYRVKNHLDVRMLPSGKWHSRISDFDGRKVLGSFATRDEAISIIQQYKQEHFKPAHALKWDDARNINNNDWLVSKWNNEIKDIDIIEIPNEFRKNTKLGSLRKGPDRFIVDEEFLWMIGLYLAEGSGGSRSINFALHKKEIEYQNRIINFFKKHGYNTNIRNSSKNGVTVHINSTTLLQWFHKWLGTKCYNKKIPEEFMRLPKNKIWALINGIYDGDGSKRDKEIGQTSEILALQLVELLHRVGEQPLVRRQQAKALTPKGNKRRLAYIVSWAEETLTRENRKGRWAFNNELLTKVTNVNKIQYSGPVYNLEVEGNHTYVVQGIVVHNCFGTGFVTGYEQYMNPRRSDRRIMVRFGPTNDDLKMQDVGLESELIPDCWTLVVPAVKDRDFIIRFNLDGTEEFRYEILDVTRNKLMFSDSGGQKFKAQRVRKFDPINQWKAVRDTSPTPVVLTTSVSFVPGPGGIPPHTHTIEIPSGLVMAQINGTTNVSPAVGLGAHNHEVRAGVVQTVLGHTHNLF
jgi:hypothetical protein